MVFSRASRPFQPENVREIPAENRSNITILWQKTRAGRVVQFCRDLGFKTLELESGLPYKLAPDFTIWCHRHADADTAGALDSFLVVQLGNCRLLNLNDYIPESVKEARAIKKSCGDLTVLFTQYSYANWVGNPGDNELKSKAAQVKITSLKE